APLRALVAGGNVRHLLFLPLSRGVYNGLHALGLGASSYVVMKWISSVAMAAAVLLMPLVLHRRLGLSSFASWATAVGFGISYGIWRYANEAEVYAIVVLLLVLVCWFAF